MSWPLVKLEQVIKISKGKKHNLEEREGRHRYIQIDDLRNDSNVKYTNDKKGVFVDAHDVVIAWDGANAGTIGYGLKGLIGSTLARLKITVNDLHSAYLGRFLQSKFDEIRANCTGATIPHVSKNHLLSIEIPFPSVTIQKQIAAVLEKADTLREQCQQMEQELNALAQAVFLEMFGDPMTNPREWKLFAISDLLIGKPQIGTTKPSHSDGTQKVVRVGELGAREVKYSKCGPITLAANDYERFRLIEGDYLLARAIGSLSHLGKASIFVKQETEYVYDSHVMRLRFDSRKITSRFFYELMKTEGGRMLFLNGSAKTSVQFNINSKQISNIKLPVPPIDEQNKFIKRLDLLNDNLRLAKEQLTYVNESFNSLMQRAFKGELDLKTSG